MRAVQYLVPAYHTYINLVLAKSYKNRFYFKIMLFGVGPWRRERTHRLLKKLQTENVSASSLRDGFRGSWNGKRHNWMRKKSGNG